MEDSFFGFDTSAPLDDDGGGRIAEPSEEEYDALNDETFGAAINGDWEEVHENLVRLTNHHNGHSKNNREGACRLESPYAGGAHLFDASSSTSSSSAATPAHIRSHRIKNELDSDLEFNLSGMKLDDMDISFDDSDNIMGNTAISMDPSVWATTPSKQHLNLSTKLSDAEKTSMLNIGQQQRDKQQSMLQQQRFSKEMPQYMGFPDILRTPKAPKICTLEDVERSIIIQQAVQKQQQQQQQKPRSPQEHDLLNSLIKETPKSPTPKQYQQQIQTNKFQQSKGPPGFNVIHGPPRPNNNFVKNIAQHPLGNLLQQQQQQQQQQHPANLAGNRMPPGFPALPLYPPLAPYLQPQAHAAMPPLPPLPPHPLLNQHPLPPNFPHPHQHPLSNPHLPIALNNFAMHPNFNAMRAAAGLHPVLVPPPMPQPRLPLHPSAPPNAPNSMFNMFNMRLMQEIQQNHPLLQNVARQQQSQHLAAAPNVPNMFMLHQLQPRQCNAAGINKQQAHYQHQHGRRLDITGGNGNLPPEEFDEYANLMSTRDKHWLIGIQLSQLNTDTPYIDDFYYTVYTERKARLNGDMRQSKTHKDNQLNHPLTQPRGHAQLILVQLGNKNGTRSNGQQHRERRNSESQSINSQEQPSKSTYVFTPMKFENSLGKLQYGSVTAPRKIIDADIMGSDGLVNDGDAGSSGSGVNASSALMRNSKKTAGDCLISEISTTQRKSRHILLHIETLFRVVLKLEDLDNPTAIATIIMKKKKENERIVVLEQMEDCSNKTSDERAAEINSSQQSINPTLMKNRFAYEIETKDALILKLVAGLSSEKVVAMMNVRKGKVLLRRIMPYLHDHDIRWSIWIGVLASLQNVVKKDREDVDGILYALYPEFKKQIQSANFETVVKLATAIPLNDKKSNGVFCSKFGISAVVCLILQAEAQHVAADDATRLKTLHRANWRLFLDQVATSLNRTMQSQTISAAIESDSIQPLMEHFARFSDLKLDSLLALITEAKQQIN